MKKILLIDDDKSFLAYYAEIITAAGFSPQTAISGDEGIRLFKKEDFSAVVLDMIMTGMDGVETLKKLVNIDHDVPVIMMTSHEEVSSVVKAINAGAYDYIIKSHDCDDFILAIKRAVEKNDLRRKIQKLDGFIQSSLMRSLGCSKSAKEIVNTW